MVAHPLEPRRDPLCRSADNIATIAIGILHQKRIAAGAAKRRRVPAGRLSAGYQIG
jgi:hypothetical protein